jgi:hypothetical protein
LKKQSGLTERDLTDVGLVVEQMLDVSQFDFALFQKLTIGSGIPGTNPKGSSCQMLNISIEALDILNELIE